MLNFYRSSWCEWRRGTESIPMSGLPQVLCTKNSITKTCFCAHAAKRLNNLNNYWISVSIFFFISGFSCGICEKWFPTRSALIRHERIHTGERPFQCEVCSKSFAQKEILYRHLMTHTGQRPYTCPHCPKGFNQKEQLRLHIRTHANCDPNDIQLHYCSLCPKVFCHASGLSRHLVTHTGKTFKCSDCEKTFTDKSSLRRHHLQTGHQSWSDVQTIVYPQ